MKWWDSIIYTSQSSMTPQPAQQAQPAPQTQQAQEPDLTPATPF